MNYRCTDSFDFTLPTKIIYGPGRVKEVVEELKALGGSRPLIITDKGIRQVGIVDIVTNLLDEAGIEYVIYDGVEANPKDVNAEDGARKAREIEIRFCELDYCTDPLFGSTGLPVFPFTVRV